MRLMFSLFCVMLGGMSAVWGNSAPEAVPTNQAVYAEAVSSLKHGHDYARAIQQLQYLVARDGASRDYRLALGCAEADRAASLDYAAMWTKMLDDDRAKALQGLAAFLAAHPELKGDTHGDPSAALPPMRTFVTKDDNHPFLMPIPQAVTQINALARDAEAQWKRALALSPTPALRAEAENVQGWGLQQLQLLASNYLDDTGSGMKEYLALPSPGEAVRAFTAATKDAPINAAYWQSLGDAQYGATKNDEYASRPEALASYNKSLALQPKNAALWYRVYQLARRGDAGDGKANSQSALPALQHVIDSDPGNAYPHYLMAALSFHQTHYSDPHDKSEKADRDKALTAEYDAAQQDAASAALAEIERGNTCPRYAYPSYQPTYPAILTGFGIWANVLRASDLSFVNAAELRELARACGGYARIAAAHGDAFGLQRGARASIGMGMRMAGDWPVKDTEPGDGSLLAALTGTAVSFVGYSDLVKGEEQIGDVPGMQATQAEFDALKQRYTAYRAVVKQNNNATSTYDYY